MQQTETGVRELKARLSAYLRRVQAGDTVVITDHGRPIARLVPIAPTLEARLEALAQTGLVAWTGAKLGPVTPVAHTAGERTVADLLLEDRE